MDPSLAAEIAARFASPLSWRVIRGLLRAHLEVLRIAGVSVHSIRGAFSLERHFTEWEEGDKGICITFAKDGKVAETICFLAVPRIGTRRWYRIAVIKEPDLRGCFLAVLTDIPPSREKLQASPCDR